jgi:Cdc6-like AAA superfamily ATPase
MDLGIDVVISYVPEDAEWVEALVVRLERSGIGVHRSQGVRPESIPEEVTHIMVLSGGWPPEVLLELGSGVAREVAVLLGDMKVPPLPSNPPVVRFAGDDGVGDQRAFELLVTLARMRPGLSNLPPESLRGPIRDHELDELVGFLEPPTNRRRLAVITGPPGIGKTSLARYLAHRLGDRFPDGRLFCSVGRRPTEQPIRLLLDGLGLSRWELFEPLDVQVEAYRTLTSGRRVLVVLDAVSGLRQVADLLPTGPGSAVVVTGRTVPDGIEALSDWETKALNLERLTQVQALLLLEWELGAERVEAEREAITAALSRLEGAPILVALLARQMREHPELDAGTVLTDFVVPPGESGVPHLGTGLERVYEDLAESDRRLFRRIELLLDPEVEVGLAATLVDVTVQDAEAVLGRLVEAQLVEPTGEGRYRIRELARDLAQVRLNAEESAEDRRAALRRALRWLAVRGHYEPDSRIARDFWTADDTLGYGQYADAIASFIRHQETRPPLTIGVKAPWGAGKTSLMRMVQERLDPPADRATWTPTRLRLSGRSRRSLADDGPLSVSPPHRRRGRSSTAASEQGQAEKPVTVLELLRRAARGPGASEAELDALGVEPPANERLGQRRDWRPTVWFNPWMYQSGEQVWAGLAHEIITQVSGRMEPGDRERFWLELNLRRVDRQAVRRRIYRLLAERFLPLALALGVAILVVAAMGLVAWLLPTTRHVLRPLSATLLSLGTVGTLVDAVRRGLGFFGEEAAGQFRRLVGEPSLGATRKLLDEQAKGSFDELLRDPGYQARLGFLYLVQTDMKRVLDLVATELRPLVVFVDDLDRCSPSTVAQVIEAINLFLAGEFPNCVFVLAVEPAVVAAHVEVAYKDLVKGLGSQPHGGRSSLGWRFLEKIVQLPLSLPLPVGSAGIDRYLDSLLGPARPEPDDGVGEQARRAGGDGSTGAAGAAGDSRVDATEDSRISAGGDQSSPSDGAAGPDRGTGVPVAGEDLRMDLVRRIEDAIRSGTPTAETLAQAARDAQAQIVGDVPDGVLLPEALEAANRVFVELYSDADSRDAIVDALPKLDSANPREIKRFINLFRFYTFVAQQDRLRGVPAPDSPEIAKLAVLAIRWPHLLNALGARLAIDGAPSALAHLERHAREGANAAARATVAEAAGANGRPDLWEEALATAGLADGAITAGAPGVADHLWVDELRGFLASEPPIAKASERLL